MKDIVPVERIENRIYVIRGQKVMLDRDLAELYGIQTSILNQAVKRNRERFPEDFMFSLTRREIMRISQFVISSAEPDREVLKYAKNVNVFTENGVAMLSSVLRSERAIQVNIAIMRAFTRLRHLLATHKELAEKFKELEDRVGQHDAVIGEIMEAIRELMTPVRTEAIGFQA